MSSRGWRSAVIGVALAAGVALPLAGLVGFASPAGAAETTFDDTCADVYGHPPAGHPWRGLPAELATSRTALCRVARRADNRR